ncbi:MAG: hypothetical protein ABL912_04245 [Novosphingobium sp.]
MSGRTFLVRGRDRLDRHIRKIESASPIDAAREYFIAYVEDWRGGHFKRLELELTVWEAESAEQAGERWFGSVIASGHERTAHDFMYQFVKAD